MSGQEVQGTDMQRRFNQTDTDRKEMDGRRHTANSEAEAGGWLVTYTSEQKSSGPGVLKTRPLTSLLALGPVPPWGGLVGGMGCWPPGAGAV